MKIQELSYLSIAPIESEAIQFVSFVSHTEDISGNPAKLILQIAMDREKSKSVFCDFPVYIDADKVFNKEEHLEMLRKFHEGQPFVTVELLKMHVFRKTADDGTISYYGTADDFRVIDPRDAKDMLEDIL